MNTYKIRSILGSVALIGALGAVIPCYASQCQDIGGIVECKSQDKDGNQTQGKAPTGIDIPMYDPDGKRVGTETQQEIDNILGSN